MKQFYHKYSIRIITGILAVILIVMYIWLTIFTNNAHLSNPVYSRDIVEKIEIKNFIGRIELTTADVEGFKLEYTNKKPEDPAGYYPLFKMGTPTIATIDGRFEPIKSCYPKMKSKSDATVVNDMAFDIIVEEDGKNYTTDSYPILKITAKSDVILDVRKSSIFGFAGNISAVKFIDVKCSDFSIGTIADAAEFNLHGNVSLESNNIVGDFSLKSVGNNKLMLQNISGNVIADMDGMTQLYIGEIAGNLVTASAEGDVVEVGNVIGNSSQN